MLKLLRKYSRSVGGLLIAGFMMLTLVSFGADSYFSGRGNLAEGTAAKVDGEEIPMSEYDWRVRQTNAQLSRQYGPQFEMVKRLLNINQQTIDGLINELLLKRYAKTMGLTSDSLQIRALIEQYPFIQDGKIDRELYSSFLRNAGLTDATFEETLRVRVAQDQLKAIFSDLNRPTETELEAIYKEQNTESEFEFVSFAAADFESSVNLQDEAALKKQFEENMEVYRKPKSISYSFIELTSDYVKDQVKISPEDLQAAYEDRLHEFVEPRQYHLRKIFIETQKTPSGLPKEITGESAPAAQSTPEQESAAKAKAEDIIKRLKAGEDFKKLAKELSADKAGAEKEGDIGWISADDLPPSYKSVVPKLDAGRHSEVLAADPDSHSDSHSGFDIVYLEEAKDERQKSLDEVRNELTEELKEELAPVYLQEAAQKLYESWDNVPSDKILPITEFAKNNSLVVKTSNGLQIKESDPEGVAPGLTAEVMSLSPQPKDRRLVDVDDSYYLVEIGEVKESFIPGFEEVKELVQKDYTKKQSVVLAREASEKMLLGLKGAADKSIAPKPFTELAAANKLEVKTTKPVTPKTASGDMFNSNEARSSLFLLTKDAPLFDKVIESGNRFYIAQLKSTGLSKGKEFSKERDTLLGGEIETAGNRGIDSLLEALRADSEIWVDPELLARNSE